MELIKTAIGILSRIGLTYFVVVILLGMRVIPNDKIGIVERWWSKKGSLKKMELLH